ncbi:hypothetical protein EDD22DRAFT_854657, partial [Suillus occidentalis]
MTIFQRGFLDSVWMELSVLHGSYSCPGKAWLTVESHTQDQIKISCWVASEEGKVIVDSSCLLLKFDIRGKLSTPEYPGIMASTTVNGVKCPPRVVLLPWKGTVNFDCVSCQYGTPPPAGFCQVVQMISPGITGMYNGTYCTMSWVKMGKTTPSYSGAYIMPHYMKEWLSPISGLVVALKFDVRGKLSTPEYLGVNTLRTACDFTNPDLRHFSPAFEESKVICQYGEPPPAGFCQMVQIISPGIT